MLNRNYRVMTGTELHKRGINRVNDRDLEKDQLLGMLFIAEPHPECPDTLTFATEIYGPFFGSPEAQMWCNNINKLFNDFRREFGGEW